MNKLNDINCISLGWLNNGVFGREIAVGLQLKPRKKCISCDSSNVQQSCLGAKKWPGWNFNQQLFSNLQESIWCRSDGFAVYENEIQASCVFVSVSSSRIVGTLHITFSWLPLPIGQVCSQVWCRPYLAAYFGFFDLRTFPWSLSQVQVSTFYPFTPKVGSKCTYVVLTSSSVKPSIMLRQFYWNSFICNYVHCMSQLKTTTSPSSVGNHH